MSFTYAGLFGPEALIDDQGRPMTSATIDVFTHGTTTHAAIYKDRLRATALANPVPTGVDGRTAGQGLDGYGNLSFFADPGVYDLQITSARGVRVVEIEIEADPQESGNAASAADAVTTVSASGASQTVTIGSGGTATYDITLTANCTLTFDASGAPAGKALVLTLWLRQDATGGRTVTWPASVQWSAQSTPTFNTLAKRGDIVQLVSDDGGTSWVGALARSSVLTVGTPAAPSLTVTPGDTANALTWGAVLAAPGVTAYKLYRSTTAGAETLYQTLGNVTSYNDTGLTNGTTYYYKLSAVNASGEGTLSTEQSGTPVSGVPGAGSHYLNVTGAANSYASTPNQTALNNLTTLDLRIKANLADWSQGGAQACMVSQWVSGGLHWMLYFQSSGIRFAYHGASGDKFISYTPGIPGSPSGGTTHWIRFTIDSSGNIQGYNCTGEDGVSWSAWGSPVAGGTAMLAASGNVGLYVGTEGDGSSHPLTGHIMALRISALGAGSDLVEVDFSTQTAGSTSFTGITGETWTVGSAASIV